MNEEIEKLLGSINSMLPSLTDGQRKLIWTRLMLAYNAGQRAQLAEDRAMVLGKLDGKEAVQP